MILTGKRIEKEIKRKNIIITDFNKSRLNPNSYNLRLSPKLLAYKENILDVYRNNSCEQFLITEKGFLLEPGKLYLGSTVEETETESFAPMISGRSSIGRLGISIHVTAGFGDVGYKGKWTLEIYCIQPIFIYPYMEICQIAFHTLFGEIDLYKGKYQNSKKVQSSKMFLEKNI